MKRVSSRQRLVSWDAFEANAPAPEEPFHNNNNNEDTHSLSSSTTTEFESSPTLPSELATVISPQDAVDYLIPHVATTAASSGAYLKRKRVQSSNKNQQSNAAAANLLTTPKAVEAFPWEVTTALHQDPDPLAAAATPNDNNNNNCWLLDGRLPTECLLRVLSFLELDDVTRKVRLASPQLQHALQSPDAQLFWKTLYGQQTWPHLNTAASPCKTKFVTTTTTMSDATKDPDENENVKERSATVATSQQPPQQKQQEEVLDYASLWPLAHDVGPPPSEMDESLFAPCRWSRSLRRYRLRNNTAMRHNHALHNNSTQVELQSVATADGRQAVRFTGTIGTGDRCVRSNQPWKAPRSLPALANASSTTRRNHHNGNPLARLFPQRSSRAAASLGHQEGESEDEENHSALRFHHHNHGLSQQHLQQHASFLDRLRHRRSHHPAPRQGPLAPPPMEPLQFRPFVAPFCTNNNNGGTRLEVNVTPRLVQYYEVHILAPPADTDADNDEPRSASARFAAALDNDNDDTAAAPLRHRNASECVAVGLSCEEFSLHTRMPGWDSWSYGYHGDDGGVFFGTGHMLRAYGPTFGAGDVVGCGLDYHRRCLFFTLNGQSLGPAWTDLSDDMLQRDWYPTVGMDTHCWVQSNFGLNANASNNAPFAFDLAAYVREHHTPAIQERQRAFATAAA